MLRLRAVLADGGSGTSGTTSTSSVPSPHGRVTTATRSLRVHAVEYDLVHRSLEAGGGFEFYKRWIEAGLGRHAYCYRELA